MDLMVSVEVLQSGIADHNLHRGQRARRGAQLENEERGKDQRYAACGLWNPLQLASLTIRISISSANRNVVLPSWNCTRYMTRSRLRTSRRINGVSRKRSRPA